MKMNAICIKLLLITLALNINGTLTAQWYSYDGFERQQVMVGVGTSVTNELITTTGRTTTKKMFSEEMDKKAEELKKLKDTIIKQRDALIEKTKTDINILLSKSVAEADPDKRTKLDEERQALNKKLMELYADRSLIHQVELQYEQFKYAKKRAPGLHLFPAGFKSASYAFFENSDTVILTKEDLFQFEHAYLNYLSQSRRIAAYTEPIYDHIGPVRVSLGLMGLAPSSKDSAVTTKKSDSIWNKKTFMDKFRSGGGIAQLNFMYPLLYAGDNKYIDFKLYASPRFAIDIPAEDTSVQRFAHHTQAGVEAQLKINTFEGNFNLLFCFRGMQTWGNSTFMDNMGFQGKNRKSFNFNTWTIGFIAKKKLAVYYTWYSGDSRAINTTLQNSNNSFTANYQF
jgi:hypothetical protein